MQKTLYLLTFCLLLIATACEDSPKPPDAATLQKIELLKMERNLLQQELTATADIIETYEKTTVPFALATAYEYEIKITDALLLQHILALESGAPIKVETRQTEQDTEMAMRLEPEIEELKADIKKQEASVKTMDGGIEKSAMNTAIATQYITLAMTRQLYLTAKYGLGQPSSHSTAAKQEPDADTENLKKENAELREKLKALIESDSMLFAAAITDIEAGNLKEAKNTLERLTKLYPTSALLAKVAEKQDLIKLEEEKIKAAKAPPVKILPIKIKQKAGVFNDETHLSFSYENIGQFTIKNIRFKVLTFDENGYPVDADKYRNNSNEINLVANDNILPGKKDSGIWELSMKVAKVKLEVMSVELYDAPTWENDEIDAWVAKESMRYINDASAKK